MWTFEHSETTTAAPAQLWARYADPAMWPQWDHETSSVTVDGPLEAGTKGRLKPVDGPAASFLVTEATPGVSFTDVTRLPLARLTFNHRIEPHGTGSRFTHTVTITGLLSPLFARVIGRNVAAGLPAAMRALGRLAEATHPDTSAAR